MKIDKRKNLIPNIIESEPVVTYSCDRYYKVPPKPNGSRWSESHLKAAELRAYGVKWAIVAKNVGVSIGAATNYNNVEGFRDLVDYFSKNREEEIKKVENAPALETTGQQLVRRSEMSQFQELIDRAYNVIMESMDAEDPKTKLDAAKAALEYTGYGQFNKHSAKLRAEKEAEARGDREPVDCMFIKDLAKRIYGIDISIDNQKMLDSSSAKEIVDSQLVDDIEEAEFEPC